MRTVRKYLPDSKFKQVLSGIFISKLIYCISVWGGLWGLTGNLSEYGNPTISKDDMNRLQVLQNSALRLLTRCDRWTPTSTLLEKAGILSVHQLGVYHTALQLFKTYRTKKPSYHFSRLFQGSPSGICNTRARSVATITSKVDFKLSTCRSSFFYQGARLWATIPLAIRSSSTESQFKIKCKEWIKKNVKIRP